MNMEREESITDIELDIALGNVVVEPVGSTNNNDDGDDVVELNINVNDDDFGDVTSNLVHEVVQEYNLVEDDDDVEESESDSTNIDDESSSSIRSDGDDDFYTRTLNRLKNQDPTLQSLEVCNLMEWGLLQQYRNHPDHNHGDDEEEEEVEADGGNMNINNGGNGNGYLDVASWFQSLSNLLRQAKYSPYVIQLDLTNLLLDYPLLSSSVQDLLLSSDCCSSTVENTSTATACKIDDSHHQLRRRHHHHRRRAWKKLSIDDCMGVEPRFVNMIQHVELSTLHISNNHLSEQSMVALGELLTHNKSICRIRISEHITFAAAVSLANSLIVNTTLHELDLLGSTFDAGSSSNDDDGNNNSSSSNNYNNRSIAVQALAKGINQNYGLRIISLGYCQLNDTNLSILIESITNHQTLTWLDLSNNCFGTKSCNALEEVILLHNQYLLEEEQNRDILPSSSSSSSTKDKAGATGPSHDAIKNNDSLSHLAGLSLVHTGIDDEKAIRIIGALAKASAPSSTAPIATNTNNSDNIINNAIRIKHLHLSENKITDYGIQILATDHNMLPTMHHLESLYLSENDFGDAGCEKLLNLAKKCCDHLVDVVVDRHLRHFDDIQYQILLNRGGHGKALKDDTILLALWPLVLERCHHVKHCCRKAGPADIIYHILKGGAGPLCHDVR